MVLPVKQALQIVDDIKLTVTEFNDTGIPTSPYTKNLLKAVEDLGDTLYAVNASNMAHRKAYEELKKFLIH